MSGGIIRLPKPLETYSNIGEISTVPRTNFYPKKKYSKPFNTKRTRYIAKLHENGANLSKSDGEKLNWLFAGPKNSPEATRLPLPDKNWIIHFTKVGKRELFSR